jgi:hypothetical protein
LESWLYVCWNGLFSSIWILFFFTTLFYTKLQIFKKEPFFHGHDNQDQLIKIAKVLGTAKLYAYLEKYGLVLDHHFQQMIGAHPEKPWSKFITPQNKNLAHPLAIDFLDKLLRYDFIIIYCMLYSVLKI